MYNEVDGRACEKRPNYSAGHAVLQGLLHNQYPVTLITVHHDVRCPHDISQDREGKVNIARVLVRLFFFEKHQFVTLDRVECCIISIGSLYILIIKLLMTFYHRFLLPNIKYFT